jgi:hypothetical protein
VKVRVFKIRNEFAQGYCADRAKQILAPGSCIATEKIKSSRDVVVMIEAHNATLLP